MKQLIVIKINFSIVLKKIGGCLKSRIFVSPSLDVLLAMLRKRQANTILFLPVPLMRGGGKDNSRRSGKVVAITVSHVLLLWSSCLLIIFENHPNGFFTFTSSPPKTPAGDYSYHLPSRGTNRLIISVRRNTCTEKRTETVQIARKVPGHNRRRDDSLGRLNARYYFRNFRSETHLEHVLCA